MLQPLDTLSAAERAQLGSLRLRRDGLPSAHPFPSAALWPEIRRYLVERSLRSNPALDPSLCAYTPGETLSLLQLPEISSWHESRAGEISGSQQTLVLVPCAKTKPWTGPAVSRSKLYSAYNELRRERSDLSFVTVSEPLGVVPMEDWADFPQYDNSGLFRGDAQQSGLTTREWQASPFGRCYGLPFDEVAWRSCIDRLGAVLGKFLVANQGRRLVAVVDSGVGPQSTHGAILDVAQSLSGVAVERHPKRGSAHVSPLPYLRELLGSGRPALSGLESAPQQARSTAAKTAALSVY